MAGGSRRFGGYLKALRHDRHLTLDDVCHLTRDEPDAVSRATLSDLENGRTIPTMGRLLQLARVYGVRPTVLVDRFETDYDLDRIDSARFEGRPTRKLLDDALRAGLAGHLHRALLMYELAERRALDGAPDAAGAARSRAALRLAEALHDAGRARLAREVLEGALAEPSDIDIRRWMLLLLCRIAVDLGDRILARGAYDALVELPRPWPAGIEGTVPYLRARLLALPETSARLLDAWFTAREAARTAAVPEVEGASIVRIIQIERARGDLDAAERWTAHLVEFAEIHGSSRHRVHALMETAQILRARGRVRDAREAWLRAKSLARRKRYHDLIFAIHAERWRNAVDDGDERTAHEALIAARKLVRHLDGVPVAYRDLGRALASHQGARGGRDSEDGREPT